MRRGAYAVKQILDEANVENKIVEVKKEDVSFINYLSEYKKAKYDAYVMFGYKEFGYAQKEARDLGISAPFFGSTTQLTPAYYDNSEVEIIDSEFPFFTALDGNYILANQFLKEFENQFNNKPFSVRPAMQAYDAMGLILNEISTVNIKEIKKEQFGDWLRTSLYQVKFYKGICGNIAIKKDGS